MAETRGGGKTESALRSTGKAFDAQRIEIECLDDETYTITVYEKEKKSSKNSMSFQKPCKFSAPNEKETLKIVEKYL